MNDRSRWQIAKDQHDRCKFLRAAARNKRAAGDFELASLLEDEAAQHMHERDHQTHMLLVELSILAMFGFLAAWLFVSTF